MKHLTIIIFLAGVGLTPTAASAEAAGSGTSGCLRLGPVRTLFVNGAPIQLIDLPDFFSSPKNKNKIKKHNELPTDQDNPSVDLAPWWLEPDFKDNQLTSVALLMEVSGNRILEDVHINLSLRGADNRKLAMLIMDLEPGFHKFDIHLEPIDLEQKPYLFVITLDSAGIHREINENNNRISTGLVPESSAPYCFSLGNSFAHDTVYCDNSIEWRGQAFYHFLSGAETTSSTSTFGDTPISGGYLYYSITEQATGMVVDSDMIRTDSWGFWNIETLLPEENSGEYRLELRLGDATLVDETVIPFEYQTCTPLEEEEPDEIWEQQAREMALGPSEIGVTPPRVDELSAVAGQPLTLSAEIINNRVRHQLPISWHVTDDRGNPVLISPDYILSRGNSIATLSFTPPKPGTYMVTVSVNTNQQDTLTTNNSASTILDIWQENQQQPGDVPRRAPLYWARKLDKCILNEILE